MIYVKDIVKELKYACFIITISIILVTLFTVLFVWIDVVETNDAILFIVKMYVRASYIILSIALAIVIIKIIDIINSGILRIKQLTEYQKQDQ